MPAYTQAQTDDIIILSRILKLRSQIACGIEFLIWVHIWVCIFHYLFRQTIKHHCRGVTDLWTGCMLQVHLLAIWNLECVFSWKQEYAQAHLTPNVLHYNATKWLYSTRQGFANSDAYTGQVDNVNEVSRVRKTQNDRDRAVQHHRHFISEQLLPSSSGWLPWENADLMQQTRRSQNPKFYVKIVGN